MRVVLVGGSGQVGTLIMPYLGQEHRLRVLDPRPPEGAAHEYFAGTIESPELDAALESCEGLVYMPLVRNWGTDREALSAQYDLQVKGLHLALLACQRQGLRRVVNVSSMSVYRMHPDTFPLSESSPRDANDVYGLAKALGEDLCARLASRLELDIVSLRLFAPLSEEDWQRCYRDGQFSDQMAAPDVARAISLALSVPLSGAHCCNLSGDWTQSRIHWQKAQQLLGWSPQARPGLAFEQGCPQLL